MCATKPSGWPCKSVTCVQAWTYILEELCIASTVGPSPHRVRLGMPWGQRRCPLLYVLVSWLGRFAITQLVSLR